MKLFFEGWKDVAIFVVVSVVLVVVGLVVVGVFEVMAYGEAVSTCGEMVEELLVKLVK